MKKRAESHRAGKSIEINLEGKKKTIKANNIKNQLKFQRFHLSMVGCMNNNPRDKNLEEEGEMLKEEFEMKAGRKQLYLVTGNYYNPTTGQRKISHVLPLGIDTQEGQPINLMIN